MLDTNEYKVQRYIREYEIYDIYTQVLLQGGK